MMNLMRSAALRLTMWYLLVIMLISITFSAIIYQISSDELGSGTQLVGRGFRSLILDLQQYEDLRQVKIREAKARIIGNLVLLNLVTLTAGGGAAYLLARRTLRPIRIAMDDQVRFTADASHELRTPLAAMRTEIEVALRDKKLSAGDAADLLASNLEEVDSLQALTDRLLQLSVNEKLTLAKVDLSSLGDEISRRVSPTAKSKGVELELSLPPVSVRADASSLSDLLVIFVDNAIKYSPAGKTVRLRALRVGRMMKLEVCDEGVGISAADMPHIFERFYRSDSARSRNGSRGHGLGLSIAARIAELHHSSVEAVSEQGKGSTFSLRLPTVS